MYLSLPSATFREAITTARTAMGTKSHIKDINGFNSLHFHVPADGRSVEITSADLDIALTQILPLDEPGGPGTACISYADLSAVKPDRATPVRIDHAPLIHQFNASLPEAQILYVKAGHSAAARLDCTPPEDFPHFAHPPAPEDFTCLIPGRTLQAIADSIPFHSKDETRYVLQGALLSPEAGGTIVATNGRILAKWQCKATPEPCILPTKACQALARLKLTAATAAFHKETLSFRHKTAILHVRTIDGNFPNYHQVIPAESTSAITFADPAGIASWLASLPTSKYSDYVRLCPRAPHHVDLIHHHGHITATAYLQNEPPEIAFNPKLLAAGLTAAPGTLHLVDHMSPGVLRHATSLAVVMPMRATTPAEAEAEAESAAA